MRNAINENASHSWLIEPKAYPMPTTPSPTVRTLSSEPSADTARSIHPPAQPHRIRSSELLHGQDRLVIEHGGESYQLRVTRLGKLILTK